jgi:hypothetical protein
MRQPYKGLFSGDLSNSGYGRKGFSPSSPKRALLPLSPKRTQVRLGSLKITPLSCLAHARSTPNPRTSFGALDLRLIAACGVHDAAIHRASRRTGDDRIRLRQTLEDFQLCAEIAINSNLLDLNCPIWGV